VPLQGYTRRFPDFDPGGYRLAPQTTQ